MRNWGHWNLLSGKKGKRPEQSSLNLAAKRKQKGDPIKAHYLNQIKLDLSQFQINLTFQHWDQLYRL